MRAGIYVRISQDQTGQALGVARQERDCRDLADRRGWTVAGIYSDNDISAFSGKVRPAYQRLLADIKAGDLDAILIWHPDRLVRAPRELEDVVDLIEATGAAVATVTAGDYDLTTPSGRMTARIIGAVARGESEHKSARARRKHLELAEGGAISGGGARPFGYEADRVTIRETEAAEIRSMVERVYAGETLRNIARDLNARGVPSVAGIEWTSTTIKRLLRSARLSGQRSHRGETVGAAVWPAILSPDDTVRLRTILDDPARRAARPVRLNLLTGLVFCGACGVRMTSGGKYSPTGEYRRRYFCDKGRHGGCGRCGINAAHTDEDVKDGVLRAIEGGALDGAVAAATDERALYAELEVLEQRLEDLGVQWADGKITDRARQAAERRLEANIAELRAQVVTEVRTARLDVNLRENWPESHDRQRAIIEAVVERVTIAPTSRPVNRFDPARITVTFRR